MVKSSGFGDKVLEFRYHLHLLLAVCLWASYLTSLYLFVIYNLNLQNELNSKLRVLPSKQLKSHKLKTPILSDPKPCFTEAKKTGQKVT